MSVFSRHSRFRLYAKVRTALLPLWVNVIALVAMLSDGTPEIKRLREEIINADGLS